jgi:hypothetical protein
MFFSHTFHVKQNGQVAKSHFHNCKDTIFTAFSCAHAISKGMYNPFHKNCMEKKYVYVGSMAYFANHMKAKLMAKGTKASQRTCFHQHFFGAEFHTNVEIKMKMEYFVTHSSIWGEICQKKFF